MRKIKSGLVEWGPQEIECTSCKDVWQVFKEDLTFWQVTGGTQWDTYKIQVAGFICPTCNKKQRIHELDNRATLLYNERVREQSKNLSYADYR